jgi:hypothetical protein
MGVLCLVAWCVAISGVKGLIHAIPFHSHLALTSGLLPSEFPTKTLHTFLFSPTKSATLPTHLISPDLIIRIKYPASSTKFEAPLYAVFSSSLLHRPSQPHTPSAPMYTVFTRVIGALFFSSLAAEKSGCVKYTDLFCGGLDLGFILV